MSRKRLAWTTLALAAIFVAGGVLLHIVTTENPLKLRITSLQTECKLGDVVKVRLDVENAPQKPFPWDEPIWYERLPFMRRKSRRGGSGYRFDLSVKGPDGANCVYPGSTDPRYSGSWRSSTLNVNEYALISKPGEYTIKGTFEIVGRSKRIFLRSFPIRILIQERTDEEMARHVADLAKRFDAARNQEERELALLRMMYTRDKRIVPTMLECEYQDKGGAIPREALLGYLPIEPETKEMLLAEPAKRGLTDTILDALRRFGCSGYELKDVIRMSISSDGARCLKAAIRATELYPDVFCDHRLIDLANDANSPFRREAITAIAINPSEKGLKTIEQLTADPDENTARLAKVAVSWARKRSIPISLLPEKLNLAAQGGEISAGNRAVTKIDKKNIAIAAGENGPERFYAVGRLLADLSDQDYAAVAGFVDNPPEERAIKKDNKAVKVIAELLRSTDKDVRDATITSIRLMDRMNIPPQQVLYWMKTGRDNITIVSGSPILYTAFF